MRELHKRNMPLIINDSNLVNAISALISSLPISSQEESYLRLTFEFSEEVNDLIDTYYSYFEEDYNSLMYNKEYLNEIDSLFDSELKNDEIAQSILPYLEQNIKCLECIGIKFKKEIYNYLLELENEIEEKYQKLMEYNNNPFEVKREKIIIKQLKKLILKRKIIFLNLKSLLTEQENIDLYYYARYFASERNKTFDNDLLFLNLAFDEEEILEDSLQRSLFFAEGGTLFSIRDQLDFNIKPEEENYRNSKIKFFQTLLYQIDKEAKKASKKNYKNSLVALKYRLMYMLDSLYDTNLFMKAKPIENPRFSEKYDFIKSEVYYFIDEILSYDDMMYQIQYYDLSNVMMYFSNVIKKIIVETYYELTGDKNVPEAIRSSKFYNKNNISTKLFDDIVKESKKKMREKKQ